MKLYRVLPDILFKSREHRGSEAIFNHGGYAMYDLRVYKEDYKGLNSMYKGLKEPSMYFYFFPEDAIKVGTQIFFGNAFRLVEYDVPEELIIENAGIGIYNVDDFGIGTIALETTVPYSKLGDKVICPGDLEDEEKKKMILDSYKETIRLQKFFFNRDILSNLDEYAESYEFRDAYRHIRDIKFSLVKSPFLTGNIWGFVEGHRDKNKEYLGERGLILDYSPEGEEKRKFVLREVKAYIDKEAFPDLNKVNKMIRNALPEYIKIYLKK